MSLAPAVSPGELLLSMLIIWQGQAKESMAAMFNVQCILLHSPGILITLSAAFRFRSSWRVLVDGAVCYMLNGDACWAGLSEAGEERRTDENGG